MNLELELEDLELLARLAKETGKSVDQLTLEAIRATYGSSVDVERDTAVAIVETVWAINVQIKKMLEAVETQGQHIRILSGKPTGSLALHERGVDTERQHAGRGNHERHTREQGTA